MTSIDKKSLEMRKKFLREMGFIASESPIPTFKPEPEPHKTPQSEQNQQYKQQSRRNTRHSPPSPAQAAPPAVSQQNLTKKKPISEYPALDLLEREKKLTEISKKAAKCELCRLHLGRTNSVPGEGNPAADVMFIGEGPGYNEDQQGRPFVGKAGQLLDKIIVAMKFTREDVFIGNIVKCRPPENRKPHLDEMEICFPYIDQQIEVIQPKVIVTLGVTSLTGLLPQYMKTPIGKIRGQWLEYRGIKVMPTLHPAYLLRQPAQKRNVWEDMQKVMAEFGIKPD